MQAQESPSANSIGARLNHMVRNRQASRTGPDHPRRHGPAEAAEQEKRDADRDQRRNIQRQQSADRQQQEQPGQGEENASNHAEATLPPTAEISRRAAQNSRNDGRE